MSDDFRKDTVKISFDTRERARKVIQVLARSHYFPVHIPASDELTRLLRLPKTSIELALEDLEKAGQIKPTKNLSGYDFIADPSDMSSGEIGFVINTDIFSGWNSLFQDWLMGLNEIMSQEGYRIRLLTSFKTIEEKEKLILQHWDQGVAGFILASVAELQIRELMLSKQIPCMLMGNATIHQQDIGVVCTDNRSGIEKVLKLLISNAHTNIFIYATGISLHEGYAERVRAYEQYMRLAGITPHSDLIFHEPYNHMMASEAVKRIEKHPIRPTAVVCTSDREAFDLAGELRRSTISIPDEISITGFANNHHAQMLKPAITTVDIHAEDMGRVAGNYMLNELQCPQMPVKILLPTNLVTRDSVARVEIAKTQKAFSLPQNPSEQHMTEPLVL